MNEWVAFGIVAVICGALAALMRWGGDTGVDGADDAGADDDR